MKLKFLHKRKEEKQTEKEAFSLPKFIIERSRAIEIVFLVLVLISALMAPFVEINYDLTEYLPSTVQSKTGTGPDGREIRLPRHGAHHD